MRRKRCLTVCVHSVLIKIVLMCLVCQASSPRVEFLRTVSKFRKRKKISSRLFMSRIKRKVRHFQLLLRRGLAGTLKKRTEKTCCFANLNDVHVAAALILS